MIILERYDLRIHYRSRICCVVFNWSHLIDIYFLIGKSYTQEWYVKIYKQIEICTIRNMYWSVVESYLAFLAK